MVDDLAFEVETPLGFRVRCTRAWWEYASTIKHPVLRERLTDVVATLRLPFEIHGSSRDSAVFLFYRQAPPRLLCVVARAEADAGFLITAYPADTVKRGPLVWSASK